jgi:hypothetical protein
MRAGTEALQYEGRHGGTAPTILLSICAVVVMIVT